MADVNPSVEKVIELVPTGEFVVAVVASTADPPRTESAAVDDPITFSIEALAGANYSFVYVNGTLTVSTQEGQTITFGPISGQTYGSPPITLAATASSGVAVSYPEAL